MVKYSPSQRGQDFDIMSVLRPVSIPLLAAQRNLSCRQLITRGELINGLYFWFPQRKGKSAESLRVAYAWGNDRTEFQKASNNCQHSSSTVDPYLEALNADTGRAFFGLL